MNKVDFPFADLIGFNMDKMEDGKSICSLEIKAQHMNPQKAVHGAVAYALADTGMGSALYSLLNKDQYCATIEIKISYLNPLYKGLLVCESEVIKCGKRLGYTESVLRENGIIVAKASGSFSIFNPSSTLEN